MRCGHTTMSSLALLTSRSMSTHHHANQPQSPCMGDQSWPTLFHGLAAFISASKLTRFIRPCRYRRRQQSKNIGRALCALVQEGKEKGLLGRLYHLTIQQCEALLSYDMVKVQQGRLSYQASSSCDALHPSCASPVWKLNIKAAASR